MTSLQAETIALARSYVGTKELTSNSGPEIDRMLAFVRCNPGDPYCAAFVSYCICKAAVTEAPRFRPSASALRLVARNEDLRVSHADALEMLRDGTPLVFVRNHGEGKGHTGFAVGLGDTVRTIEANTGPGPNAPALDRNGNGIFERNDRWPETIHHWIALR